MTDAPSVRSFVRRDSRITRAQQNALDRYWSGFALPAVAGRAAISDAFARRAPLNLEIGSGDGEFVTGIAYRVPAENFVAVEVYRPGLGRLLLRARELDLGNVRIVGVDACEWLATLQGPVFDRVFVFFPDPWPKKRHHKRRLLQARFFDLLAPRLRRNGRVFFATDNMDYADSVAATVDALPAWINLAGPRRRAPRFVARPVTKFERRALRAGSEIFDFVFALR